MKSVPGKESRRCELVGRLLAAGVAAPFKGDSLCCLLATRASGALSDWEQSGFGLLAAVMGTLLRRDYSCFPLRVLSLVGEQGEAVQKRKQEEGVKSTLGARRAITHADCVHRN